MGQNIGTCVTAIISSVGANKNAKRASMIHLYFNLIGTLVFMAVFYGINAFVQFDFLDIPASALGIAVIHSCFNVACAVLMFPFSNGLLRLATITIKDKPTDNESKTDLPAEITSLDERFLSKPGFAMELCRNAAFAMARETKECIFLALDLLSQYNEDKAKEVIRKEQLIDTYEDVLGTYMVKLSGKDLSHADSRALSIILHCTSDFERISDHAVNILDSVNELREKKQSFSDEALEEMKVLVAAVHEIVNKTVNLFVEKDISSAKRVEPLEEVID